MARSRFLFLAAATLSWLLFSSVFVGILFFGVTLSKSHPANSPSIKANGTRILPLRLTQESMQGCFGLSGVQGRRLDRLQVAGLCSLKQKAANLEVHGLSRQAKIFP